LDPVEEHEQQGMHQQGDENSQVRCPAVVPAPPTEYRLFVGSLCPHRCASKRDDH
jgi:hypothetical protein